MKKFEYVNLLCYNKKPGRADMRYDFDEIIDRRGTNAENGEAVSYTHLDVYKRQR